MDERDLHKYPNAYRVEKTNVIVHYEEAIVQQPIIEEVIVENVVEKYVDKIIERPI